MEYVQTEFRGRVMSINMLAFPLMPLGILPLTALAESTGIPFALGVVSLLFVAVSLALLVGSPRLRALR